MNEREVRQATAMMNTASRILLILRQEIYTADTRYGLGVPEEAYDALDTLDRNVGLVKVLLDRVEKGERED